MKLFDASILTGCILALQSSAEAPVEPVNPKHGMLRLHDDTFAPDVILRVTYENVSIGCNERQSALINGTLPGPEVRIPPGKSSWIRVYNDIPDRNTSMHWHGLSQRTAAFSDGTPSATQWPIPPLHFFDYEVHPEADDAGTYFYHSHVGFQMSTASGALIVEDAGKPPYEYDEERILLFSDYFNKSDYEIEQGLTSTPFVWSGEPNVVLINGRGVPMTEPQGSRCCKLPMVSVDPGKTYRVRFIGATSLSIVGLDIADHEDLTIIAADGQYTKPHSMTYMQISSGQRFDVLLKTKRKHEVSGADYAITYQTMDSLEVFSGRGYLHYSIGHQSLLAHESKQAYRASCDWLEYALEPLKPNNFPSAAEVTRRVTIYARQLTTNTAIWTLNYDQWNETTVFSTPDRRPYLVDIYMGGPFAIPNYEAALQNSG